MTFLDTDWLLSSWSTCMTIFANVEPVKPLVRRPGLMQQQPLISFKKDNILCNNWINETTVQTEI